MQNLIFLNDIIELIYKMKKRLTDFENKPMVTKEEMSGEGYQGKG